MAVKNSVIVFGIIAKHAVNADKQIIIANTLRLFFIVVCFSTAKIKKGLEYPNPFLLMNVNNR